MNNETSPLWKWFQRHFEELSNNLLNNVQPGRAPNLGSINQDFISCGSQINIYEEGSEIRVHTTEDQRFATGKAKIEKKIAQHEEFANKTSVRNSTLNQRLSPHTSTRISVGPSKRKKVNTRLFIQAPVSARDELTRLLYYLLFNDEKHLIHTLVRHFQEKFSKRYFIELLKLGSTEDLEEVKRTYEQVCFIVKCFVKLINKFIFQVYQKYVKKMHTALNKESYEVEWIIDSIVYEALFSQIDSNLSKLTFGLFRKIHAHRVQKLKNIIEEKKSVRLEDDENLVEKYFPFLMEKNSDPYKEVINKISELKLHGNPYKKFEIILSLERQILTCAREYYTNNTETQKYLQNNFEMDVKFPIMIYCVLKSQNEEVVIDNAFVEEFVDKECLDYRQDFKAFMGVVSVFLLGEYED